MSEHTAENDAALAAMTDEELRARAQGCTELSCPYHGLVNAERRRRVRVIPPRGGLVDLDYCPGAL